MTEKQIPVKSFYSGSTKKEYFYLKAKRRKRIALETKFKERPLPTKQNYDTCFSERYVWKWFHRQQDALDYCVTVKERCARLFAYEKSDGKRSYLVTTCKQFWTHYSKLKTAKRHFYEVIRQTDECRLYFDIEFKFKHNPGLVGCQVLKTFIQYVCYCVLKQFDIICTEKNIIDLSSSTDTKFSRHLIFNHSQLLFSDNIQCGEFVKEICRFLKDFIATGVPNKYLPIKENFSSLSNLSIERLREILVLTEKNDETFLCDLSVYTKNRNFRLYKSSKVSKNVPLEVSKDNKYVFRTKAGPREKYLKYQMRNILFDADFEKFADTLVCPQDQHTENELLQGNSKEDVLKQQQGRGNCSHEDYKTGATDSPFPQLEKFVIELANKNGPKSHIRRWMHYEERQMIIYDIGGNRWCGNVQREHKSNHVYYVADLKFCHVYQKCHDFECCSFRSVEVAIPKNINPVLNREDTIEEFEESFDEELMKLFDQEIDFVGKQGEATLECERIRAKVGKEENDQEMPESSSIDFDFFQDDFVFDEEVDKLFKTKSTNNHGGRNSPPAEEEYFIGSDDEFLLDQSLLNISNCTAAGNDKSDLNVSGDLFTSTKDVSDLGAGDVRDSINQSFDLFCSPGQFEDTRCKRESDYQTSSDSLDSIERGENTLEEIFKDDFIPDDLL